MIRLKHWTRQKNDPDHLSYDLRTKERDKVSVYIPESWNAEDTGHVLIDFVIQTERGHIKETIFIPRDAFKELIRIQKQGKVTRK